MVNVHAVHARKNTLGNFGMHTVQENKLGSQQSGMELKLGGSDALPLTEYGAYLGSSMGMMAPDCSTLPLTPP